MKISLTESIYNDDLKIPNSHIKKVCLYGKEDKTCRYLALSINGFFCVKNSPLKAKIDYEVLNNQKWRAKGNNCDGFQTNEKEKSQENKKDQEAS